MSIILRHGTFPLLVLYQPQQDTIDDQLETTIANDVDTKKPPVVTEFFSSTEFRIVGRVTGRRLAQRAGYSSDWLTAIGEYIAELEARVTDQQGDGYTIEDNHTGETREAVVHTLEWRMNRAAPYEVTIDMQAVAGTGTLNAGTLDVTNITTRTGTDIYARFKRATGPAPTSLDLPGFQQLRVRRSFDYEVQGRAFADTPSDNEILPKSGVSTELTYDGIATGSPATRQTFDDNLRDEQDAVSPVFSVVPWGGYEYTGKVVGVEPERLAETGTQRHEYKLRFMQAAINI